MTPLKRLILFVFLIIICKAPAQGPLAGEEALANYRALKSEYKSKNLGLLDEDYWPYYFQSLDLLKSFTDNHRFVMREYLNMAYNFRHLGLNKESIELYNLFFTYYNKNEQHLTVAEKEELFQYHSSAYGYLADVYAKASHLDSAGITHKKNIKLAQDKQDVKYASALNNYGLFFYWTMKELDSALIYFNKSYRITKEKFPEDHLIGSIRDNIADIYVEQGRLLEANSLYKENFEFYKNCEFEPYKGIDLKRFIAAGVQLIDTSIELGQINDTDNILDEMNQMLSDTIVKMKLSPISELDILQIKERVLNSQNQTTEAYHVSKRVKFLSDSLTQISTNQKKKIESTINELTFERLKTQHVLEKQQRENKINNQRLKLWIISISSISVLGILSLLYIRRRQRITIAQNNQQIAELKNEKLHSEIESKKRDLSDFAINLTQNQEWAKELANKLDHLKSTRGRERKNLMDAFEQDIQNKITFDVDTKAFYDRLDKLSDAFYSELNSKFPGLSKTDKRLCSLIRLKIDSHKIARLQNISLSSLNTSRYRLRKKLNLSKENDLDDFIQGL